MYLLTIKELSDRFKVDERTIQNYAEEAEKEFNITVRNERGIYNLLLFSWYLYLKMKKNERAALKASENDKSKSINSMLKEFKLLTEVVKEAGQLIPTEDALNVFSFVITSINTLMDNLMNEIFSFLGNMLTKEQQAKIIGYFNDTKSTVHSINYKDILNDETKIFDNDNNFLMVDQPR